MTNSCMKITFIQQPLDNGCIQWLYKDNSHWKMVSESLTKLISTVSGYFVIFSAIFSHSDGLHLSGKKQELMDGLSV